MTDTTAAVRCRVTIDNRIDGTTKTLETARDRSLVFLDLAAMIRTVNRRRDETLKGALHLLRDQIILRWHCPHFCCDDMAAEIIRLTSPLREVEDLIRKGVAS